MLPFSCSGFEQTGCSTTSYPSVRCKVGLETPTFRQRPHCARRLKALSSICVEKGEYRQTIVRITVEAMKPEKSQRFEKILQMNFPEGFDIDFLLQNVQISVPARRLHDVFCFRNCRNK